MNSTFKEYMKYHEPEFVPVTPAAEYYYYCGIACYECEVMNCEKGSYQPFIHKNQLIKIKEEHPEYFI